MSSRDSSGYASATQARVETALMITAIEIPKLTLTMEGGTLVRWLKHEGEPVQKDEVLFELETDKANAEVPSPANGLLKKIVIQEGPVAVGSTVGFIGDEQDVLSETAVAVGGLPVTDKHPSSPAISTEHEEGTPNIRATPAARRRAREAGLDLASISGTGPDGRLTQEDVEAAIARRADVQPRSGVTPDFRKMIAERTSQAWRTVPHIHVGGELVGAGLNAAIEKAREAGVSTITLTDLLLFCAASVLRSFPQLNAVWCGDRAEPRCDINLGFAVHTDRGVVIPVIHGVEHRNVFDISSERVRLKNAVLNRSLRLAELEGGTFTLSNLGMFPVDFFAPVVNYPECAMLATGRLRKVASVDPEASAPVWKIWANVAVDHRVADGAVAAQFLAELERAFENLRSLTF